MSTTNKITTKNIFAVIALAILFSCQQQEIVIPQPPYQGKVSIQGIVEPDSIPLVFFNRTVPFLTGSTNTGDLLFRNAIVKIRSSEGVDVLKLDSTYNKVDCRYDYVYKGSVAAKTATIYTLEIINGLTTYTATATTSVLPVTIDSISYTPTFKDIYGDHEGVITYFKDIPNTNDFYRYEMLRTVDSTARRGEKKLYGSCLANETILYNELGRSVYNDQGVQGQQIKIVIEPALSHIQGTVGYIRVQTIDKATYEFYDQIDRQKLGLTNPFVEPVYLTEGQFGKDAFGFFGARVRSAPVKFIFPE
jgi:hypothetical protein